MHWGCMKSTSDGECAVNKFVDFFFGKQGRRRDKHSRRIALGASFRKSNWTEKYVSERKLKS